MHKNRKRNEANKTFSPSPKNKTDFSKRRENERRPVQQGLTLKRNFQNYVYNKKWKTGNNDRSSTNTQAQPHITSIRQHTPQQPELKISLFCVLSQKLSTLFQKIMHASYKLNCPMNSSGQAVLSYGWIKIVKIMFWSITQEPSWST